MTSAWLSRLISKPSRALMALTLAYPRAPDAPPLVIGNAIVAPRQAC